MKIAVVGTRGFPNVQGGIEEHCRRLYPRLAKLGCHVTVFARAPYVDKKVTVYEHVKITPINCPKSQSLETFVHTFKAVLAAAKFKPDILHIHAIGPGLFTPLARKLGMKVIVTNHGPDYERKKWGRFAKAVLRFGERMTVKYANEIICISEAIAYDLEKKYKRKSRIVHNGIEIPRPMESHGALERFHLTKHKYILTVGRYVPEKGFDDLMVAFNMAKLKDWKLVIVGQADHESDYSLELKIKSLSNKDIILTGYQGGDALKELFTHAGLFVLPSYFEGLSISLLEAMSYGLRCVASDIPANIYVDLPRDNYFPVGNIAKLSEKIIEFINKPMSSADKARQIDMLRHKYDWEIIAHDTLEIYKIVLSDRPGHGMQKHKVASA